MRETADVLGRLAALETELVRLRTLVDAPPTSDGAVPPHEQACVEPSASRRDLLRYGAVALGAAAAAGMAASPVEAGNGDPLVIGITNNGAAPTTLAASGGVAFWATSSGVYGVIGQSPSIGVYGTSTSTSANNGGVFGYSTASTGQTPGVSGLANATEAPGVYGTHGSGNGVRGDTLSENGGSGVYGRSLSSFAGLVPGVYGHALSPNAPAVYGRNEAGGNAMRAEVPSFATENAIAMYALNYSTYTGGDPGAGGFAIYGLSAKGHGLVGATAAAGAAAVVGATNGVADAWAAAFYGRVIVGGDFTVVGGAKSAAVPHPDGSHRRLYCMESPESWFEDFGRGTLVCGEATVALDPDFAAVVDTADYHVFLTAYDSDSYLNVVDRSPRGFRVRASQPAEGTFSWRVVAKRKDIAGARLERVEIPKEPTLPDVPASVYEPGPSAPDLPRMAVPPRLPNRKL